MKTRKDLEDLTGERFGELVVLEYEKNKSREHNQTYWKCKCSCGKICSIGKKHLRDGTTISCGHLRVQSGKDHISNFDKMKTNHQKYNTNLETIRNQKMQPNNTSGVKGVDYHRNRDEWRARVYIGRKEITKWFKTKEEAVECRNELIEKYYKPKISLAIKNGDLRGVK